MTDIVHTATRRSLYLLGLLAAFSCQAVEDSQFIPFKGKALETGRTLWIENCKGCHAYGTAGAPIPMVAEEWKQRVIKDREVLYDHAINGFFGPDDTMMPERGGNINLSDQQVKFAVDYMVELATYYIKQN